MWRSLPIFLLLFAVSPIQAAGLLVPTEKKVPPLAMLEHHVTINIEDQVAVTKVEQTFRNHTDRQLEATYIFPVPKGASVQKFTMWVNGEEVHGELVEAKKARKIYEDIVRRTQDPGLLEYIDHNLLKVRVFPVPANGEQKLSFQYVSVADKDLDVVQYIYPLKTDGGVVKTLKKYSINVNMKSQHPLQNIYSPTHAIQVTRKNDKEAKIAFNKDEGTLDRNFILYYTAGKKDVGLTTLIHRPIEDMPGYFMMLISPRAELSKEQQVPRDIVFVLDTSGSMRGNRITQARSALKYCLRNLREQDRFGIMHFSTTTNEYAETWTPATAGNRQQASRWVDGLFASGGTAINDALLNALRKRSKDESRNFTIVFFTDGQPTVGETRPEQIVKNVMNRNNKNTRIFTFGVGNDVNATMLDQMAEKTKAITTYVRENEDIEDRVSSLYFKISHPVLTNLKLSFSEAVKVSEVYPPHLPDLFHGSQLVVLGRYKGAGQTVIKLKGNVGKISKEFVYEFNYPEKIEAPKDFVEDLWARRKVGYLLDQIRINGEQQELVSEVVKLAKRYGITTPYTSYLIVPDEPKQVTKSPVPASRSVPDVAFRLNANKQSNVTQKANSINNKSGSRGKGKNESSGSKDSKTTPLPVTSLPSGDQSGQKKTRFTTKDPAKKLTAGLTSPFPGPNVNVANGGFNFGGFGGGFNGVPAVPQMIQPFQPFGGYVPTTAKAKPGQRVQWAPVVVTPGMTWGVPNTNPTVPLPANQPYPTYSTPKGEVTTVKELAKLVQQQGIAKSRIQLDESESLEGKDSKSGGSKDGQSSGTQRQVLDTARLYLNKKDLYSVQNGKLGVDLSVLNNQLRNQSQLLRKSAVKRVQNRNCVELGGIWIDDGFDPKMTTLTVKALSPAYFELLQRHPEVKDVFRLGNHVVWVTPRNVALIIDTAEGRESLSDREMDMLFTREIR